MRIRHNVCNGLATGIPLLKDLICQWIEDEDDKKKCEKGFDSGIIAKDKICEETTNQMCDADNCPENRYKATCADFF